MKNDEYLVFGEPAQFAIRFKEYEAVKQVNRSGLQTDYSLQVHAHFVIGGEVVGIEDDQFMLGTWLGCIERFLGRMQRDEIPFYDAVFAGLGMEEVLALVFKANQLEEEYDPQFAHLPVKDSGFWNKHMLHFGYITDWHLLVFFDDGNGLKIIHTPWREYEAKNGEALHMARVDAQVVLNMAEQFVSYAHLHYRL